MEREVPSVLLFAAVMDTADMRSETDPDEALIGSMVRQGFLSQAKNMVLLSVDGGDRDRVDALRQRLSREIDQCLNALTGSGTVLDQAVHTDKRLRALSRSLGVTPGKAALIRQILEDHGDLDWEDLAKLPLSELQTYLKKNGADLRDYTNCSAWDDDPDDEDDDQDDPDDEDDEDDEPDDSDDRYVQRDQGSRENDSVEKDDDPDDEDDDSDDPDDGEDKDNDPDDEDKYSGNEEEKDEGDEGLAALLPCV